jgi:hypothetical protein
MSQLQFGDATSREAEEYEVGTAAPPAGIIPTGLRGTIVATAARELARWNVGGRRRETDPRMTPALADYWRTGAGVAVTDRDLRSPQFQNSHPWSAAFISWVMRKAGAGRAFAYSASHATYVAAAKRNRLTNNGNPFRAYRVSEARPQVGDLVCKSRAGSGATYDNIRPGMATHCDIVLAVGPRSIRVVGGNVDNSVADRSVPLTADGRLAPPEYFAVVKIEAPGVGPSPAPTPTPVNPGAGRTLYAPIDLGIVVGGRRVRPQTGIFEPVGWRPGATIDLVVFFHGIRSVESVEAYWNAKRDRRFNLREEFTAAGKNALLAIPLLGPRSQNQIGSLGRPGGLDAFVGSVLGAMQSASRLQAGARVGNLIFACHSGGGLAMRTVGLAPNTLAPSIRECWGFDCTYNSDDPQQWSRWARLRPASRLVIRYITASQTEPRAKQLAALGLPNVTVGPSRTRDHNSVPQAHFRELLSATSSLQPRSS